MLMGRQVIDSVASSTACGSGLNWAGPALRFKQATHIVGTCDYHFWMACMKKVARRGGNQHLHLQSEAYRRAVRRKLHAYHVFLFMGVVTQGLMHYLSACHTELVWRSFGSWLRTIRTGVAPTELVVTIALQNTLSEFLLVGHKSSDVAKFIIENQDPDRVPAGDSPRSKVVTHD
jgi:hypothetical protein